MCESTGKCIIALNCCSLTLFGTFQLGVSSQNVKQRECVNHHKHAFLTQLTPTYCILTKSIDFKNNSMIQCMGMDG